jgi:WXG100 family type VII secretion target
MADNVRHLDTKAFDTVIAEFKNCVNRFNHIIGEVDNTIMSLDGEWEGEGKTAFWSDAKTVRTNLVDIEDFMNDMVTSLTQAKNLYVESDKEIGAVISGATANGGTSGGGFSGGGGSSSGGGSTRSFSSGGGSW